MWYPISLPSTPIPPLPPVHPVVLKPPGPFDFLTDSLTDYYGYCPMDVFELWVNAVSAKSPASYCSDVSKDMFDFAKLQKYAIWGIWKKIFTSLQKLTWQLEEVLDYIHAQFCY